ncbi:MAG TPA: LLM class F420-dependent oxidoreductase, partial [Acidimicrobiaceae bacterium]|nr:LLM class F420-dependent oxidoreductase [Acidimicrobiaceae bacterium]
TIPDQGKLEHYESLGIAETVLRVPSVGRDEVLFRLDEHARFLG